MENRIPDAVPGSFFVLRPDGRVHPAVPALLRERTGGRGFAGGGKGRADGMRGKGRGCRAFAGNG